MEDLTNYFDHIINHEKLAVSKQKTTTNIAAYHVADAFKYYAVKKVLQLWNEQHKTFLRSNWISDTCLQLASYCFSPPIIIVTLVMRQSDLPYNIAVNHYVWLAK